MARSIVIVGASLAGMHAAQALRREGHDGPLVVVDADAHTPYDKPPLSKQFLAGTWDEDRIALAPAQEDLGIDWRLGHRAASLDVAGRVLTLADGDRLTYDGLLLAVGAGARRLPGVGELEGVHVLRTLDDAIALRADLDRGPARVAVIGAGFIGAEVAATCRERGLEVTIIEALEVPMVRALGRQLGAVCADVQRDHGVELRLGVGVDGLVGSDRVEGVRLADGSVVEAEVVVVGIGVTPNTGWLDGSGLTLDDGVVCDATLLAAPGVVAAGDVARWPSQRFGGPLRVEHWEHAIQMGEAAARRLLVPEGGEAEVFDPVPWFWSDQYDRKIQLAGRPSPDGRVEIVHGSTAERRFVALYEQAGRVVGVFGMNRPRHVMQLRGLVADQVPFDEAVMRARELG